VTIFERVKAGVSVRDAAQHYGMKISNNNMICCPFHNDRHPSMKLNRDYFFCFACGATGDVIDFVGRLFGIRPIEAARRIAADFGINTDKPFTPTALKPRYPKVKAFREDEIYCFHVLCDYLKILEDWKVRYAPKSPDEEIDDRFAEACQMLDYITCLADILTVGSFEERVETVKELLADGKMQELEKLTARIRKEEENEQHTNKEQ